MYQEKLIKLLNELKKEGGEFNAVYIEYDGYGDSGCIEGVFLELPQGDLIRGKISKTVVSFFYDYIEEICPGWEINEGSSGKIKILLKDDEVKIEHLHQERFEYYEDTYYEESIPRPQGGASTTS